MEIRSLRQAGMSVSEIARELDLDRKTVRKYLSATRREYHREARPTKLAPYAAWIRERWEQGVRNSAQLLRELRGRGYSGGGSQLRRFVSPWRKEAAERAFVRFETEPGWQGQVDWGQMSPRVYVLALTLGWSRMRFVHFGNSQDIEHLLDGLAQAFEYLGGVPREILADNMKTVVLERRGGEIGWNPRFLDFALYYGFTPRLCWPRRPQTKGKVESSIGYVQKNFWPGIAFGDLADLNRQGRDWMEYVNRLPHATTREAPALRWPREGLGPLPPHRFDTGYADFRKAAKDCLISYGGNRYSVPHAYAGKSVVVRRAVDGDRLRIHYQADLIAEHALSPGRGDMIIDRRHYEGLPGLRSRFARERFQPPAAALLPGPGVGRGFAIPVVVERDLAVYDRLTQEGAHVATI